MSCSARNETMTHCKRLLNATDHASAVKPSIKCKSALDRKQSSFYPVRFKPFRTFPHVGHGVGQTVDPYQKVQICNKKNTRNPKISGVSWSCWADSNRRPHPYQGCALPTELQQHIWRPGTGSNRRPLA